MPQFIDLSDIDPFITDADNRLSAMIEDAEALAIAAAPCLVNLPVDEFDDPIPLTAHQRAVVKAILRGALVRWFEAGSGAVQSETVGPFGVTYDTKTARRGMFYPSELEALQAVCGSGSSAGRAWSVDTAPEGYGIHLSWCSINFGAVYCSCGADIAGSPIFQL